MREIKFRAWSKKGKKYLFFEAGEDYGDFWDIINMNFYNFILEQYTGLKDKNGAEIYDGDIYENNWGSFSLVSNKIKDDRETTGHGRTERFIVSGFSLYSLPNDFEIVGTIHENIELLDGLVI